jgi:hypothetical protein
VRKFVAAANCVTSVAKLFADYDGENVTCALHEEQRVFATEQIIDKVALTHFWLTL